MTEDKQPEEGDVLEELLGSELDAPEDPDPIAELQARLEETEREKDQFRNAMLRSAADLENYKKRAAQDLSAARERANERIITKLIDVADNFSRAVNYLPEDAIDPSWFQGISLAQRGLDNLLESEGVSRIEAPIGAPFDVTQHEAVFFEPTNAVDEGMVARVVRNGYKLHDRVLRAAQVSVAQAPPDAQNAQNTQETQTENPAQQQTSQQEKQ